MVKTEMTNYLIIGNSAGGIGAAEAIREVDKAGAITIVSDEPYPAYSRPMISDYLVERCPIERMRYRPADFYEKNGIRTILGEKAARVDGKEHVVKLENGRRLTWRKLLLATGGLPIVPKIEGIGLKGVFTFTKLDDARAIDEFLNQYTKRIRAVVIGGGLIGASVTEALVKRGVQVTIVEMKERVLNTMLDEEASALEEKALTQAGVEIICGRTADRIDSYFPEEVSGVSLDDGRSIPCEMVIIAIGVQPRLELIPENSIMTNWGILVDLHMETSIPDVYACGDVAEAYDFVYRNLRLNPVWPNAYTGGRTAGLNMAGIPTKYPGGTAINAMKYFGVNIVSAGMLNPPDDSYETISERHGDIYKKVVVKDGIIVGMVLVSDIEKSGIIYSLMKDRVNVDSFKEVLVADDFGLASLPEEIWRERLAIPPPELASSVTPVEPPQEVLISE
jgi:NAD(P)H-nitrite reductase large subunit